MSRKLLFATVLVVAGAAAIGPSAANAPPLGTEQFEEWFDNAGNMVGYVHWTCDGQRETWGGRNGHLTVTRLACPSP